MLGFNDFAARSAGLDQDGFIERHPFGFLLEASDSNLLNPFFALDAQYNIEFPEEETDCTKTYVLIEESSLDIGAPDLGGDDEIVIYDEPSERERREYAVIPLALRRDRDFVIGRQPTSDAVIPKGFVSKQHLSLRAHEGRIEVRDLGSRNGTLHNDAPLPAMKWVPLEDSDTLTFSPQLVFRFVSSRTMYEMLGVGPRSERR